MCTAAVYKTKDFYFGRTLDYDFSYGETVTVMPRNYPLKFRRADCGESGYAVLGMTHTAEGYPLFYDGINEKGVGMAGLNFVGNAVYEKGGNLRPDKDNVPQFEFIPWVLRQCATVGEARELLKRVSITDEPFEDMLPAAQLHWIIADKSETVTVEATEKGLFVYDNPVGVLTNNPPFDVQMLNLQSYMSLSPKQPENNWKIPLSAQSRGMGAVGLPGDLSSQSRFVRAAFTKTNSLSDADELSSVSQFFHILGSVEQQRGCCQVADGKYEITVYTSCCNASRGIYYYKTYDNHTLTAVDMHREDLDGRCLVTYPVIEKGTVFFQN